MAIDSKPNSAKIAVVGCGAVGSYYGAKLLRDGHEVHFLLRSDYEVVRRKGLAIHSPQGDFHVHPKCARAPEKIGVADLVLIGLKTTANDQFAKLLPPLVGAHTAIVTLQNGLGNEEQLARLFPLKQILGGLCFVCLNRLAPGLVEHIGEGQVVLGEFQGWPEHRTHDLASLFRRAGVPAKVTEHLARAHWEKLVWNIPFNGLGVASAAGFEAVESGQRPVRILEPCLTTDKLLQAPRWAELVRELMDEVIRAGAALGMELKPDLAENLIARTRLMGAYKASTLLDFEKGLPLEMEAIFLEPLRQARLACVNTPRLEALGNVLRQLEAARAAQGC